LQTRIFETDWLGRATLITQPESGSTSYAYAYNASPGYGLTVTRTRPEENQPANSTNTVVTTTQYDSVGRVVSVNYNDGFTPSRGFSYDVNNYWAQTGTNLKGRLAVTGTGGTATWTGSLFSYDAMGRVVNIWQCAPATCGTANQAARPLSFAYDWAGNLIQESDGVSGTIVYGRSVAGEVTSITNATYQDLPYDPPNLVSNVVNGPNGPVSYTLGNGLNVYHSYDPLGRYVQQWVCNGPAAGNCSGGTAIYGTASQWKGSQMQSQSDTVLNQGVTFGYGDGFNRLTARTVTSGTVQNYTYSYDRYGNRVSQTALQSGYNFNPTINQANNQIITSGYTYDPAGNMLNDSVNAYTYDAEGNLVKVVGPSGTSQYVYDVFNRRVHVQTPSATTEYIYDYAGRKISGWLSPNNYGNQGRIYWGGQQVAFRASDGTNFDHQDILGTERLRTTYSGAVGSTYTSLPWGDGYAATVNNAGADQDNEHFAGLERDAESGTEHAQFRNYASAQGRWLAPDSYMGSYDLSNPESMNRYAYVLNNPLSLVDPTGLDCGDSNGTDIGDAGGTGIEVGGGCNPPDPAPSQPGNWCGGVAWGTEGCIQPPCGYPGASTCSGPGSTPDGTSPTGPPRKATLSETPNKPSVLDCASGVAQATSIAGGLNSLGIGNNGGVGGFLTNALAGNAASGIVDLFRSGGSLADVAFSGTRLGIPGASNRLGNGISGVVQDATVAGIHSVITTGGELTTLAGTASIVGLTGAEYATGFGEIKFGYDAVTYAGGLVGCKLGVIH
jgi:RHS repeat-associated protein